MAKSHSIIEYPSVRVRVSKDCVLNIGTLTLINNKKAEENRKPQLEPPNPLDNWLVTSPTILQHKSLGWSGPARVCNRSATVCQLTNEAGLFGPSGGEWRWAFGMDEFNGHPSQLKKYL